MAINPKLVTHTDNREEVMAGARAALPSEVIAFIEECLQKPHPHSFLISVLHKVQGAYGYLPPEQLDAVSQLMQIPAAKVTGVATFYHYFRLTPRGRFVIHVCLGTACYVKGAERVTSKIKEELGIDFGETTSDGLFSLEAARCLGTCALAPVIMVGDKIHGDMTADKIPALIEEYAKQARAEAKKEAEAPAN